MRLDKFLSGALQIPRSAARALAGSGRVTVDGQLCRRADAAVPDGALVALDGAPLTREEHVYLMLNKPAGVVSASEDGRDTTVVDLVRGDYPRRELFPAGRLDKTSTGFVLLTDDGPFAHRLLAPRRHVPKTYRVGLDGPVTGAMVEGFAAGVTLADGQTLHPARLVPDPADPCAATVVLTQGVYHQIKRMFGVYGLGVDSLHRTAIGGVELDPALAPGRWRPLTAAEKDAIFAPAR